MPRSSRLLVSLAATAATVGLLATSPSVAHAAPGDTVVSVTDPAGDVKLYNDDGGLSDKQRRSIDLRKLTVKERAGGDMRFIVKLKQLTTSRRFDQIVEVRLLPTDPDAFWSATVGMSPQHRNLAYAFYSPTLDGDDTVSCDPLRAKVREARRTVSVDVPKRCLPKDPARVRVGSYTGHFRSEGVGYSRDRLKPPGSYDLR